MIRHILQIYSALALEKRVILKRGKREILEDERSLEIVRISSKKP